MLEELGQDYIRTARAKGLPERTVVYRHALRNAMIPILTVVGLQFGALLAGTIVTETIFSWPGIGRLTIQAIANRDYYLVQGCILAIGLTYVAVNFLTDLLYSALTRGSDNNRVSWVGHVLSPATKFEDPTAVHEQWSPILNEFCAQNGVTVEPIYGN